MQRRHIVALGVIALIIMGGVMTLGGNNTIETQHDHVMPDYVENAHPDVQVAYEYALDYPNDLAQQPCYCGCKNMGHKNNLECFIAGEDARGETIFDQHGAYCNVCVDIAIDTIRLKREGWTPLQIRLYLDKQYPDLLDLATDTAYPEA